MTRAGLPTPLYHQVQLVLHERIEQGYYGRGGLIPGEVELSREFSVSRITVARAINELALLGLVERRRGVGTRVRPRDLPSLIQADIESLPENLTEMGSASQVKVLDFGFVLPSPDVEAELAVGANELVQRAVRVRSFNSVPFSYLTSFVPSYVGHRFTKDDLAVHSLLSLLEERGIEVGSARQSVSAVLADPRTGAELDVPVGAPLLAIARTVRDKDGKPVEYIRVLYRTDCFQ